MPTDRDSFLIGKLNDAVNKEGVRNQTYPARWRNGSCINGGQWGGMDQIGAAAAILQTDIVAVRHEVCGVMVFTWFLSPFYPGFPILLLGFSTQFFLVSWKHLTGFLTHFSWFNLPTDSASPSGAKPSSSAEAAAGEQLLGAPQHCGAEVVPPKVYG